MKRKEDGQKLIAQFNEGILKHNIYIYSIYIAHVLSLYVLNLTLLLFNNSYCFKRGSSLSVTVVKYKIVSNLTSEA